MNKSNSKIHSVIPHRPARIKRSISKMQCLILVKIIKIINNLIFFPNNKTFTNRLRRIIIIIIIKELKAVNQELKTLI